MQFTIAPVGRGSNPRCAARTGFRTPAVCRAASRVRAAPALGSAARTDAVAGNVRGAAQFAGRRVRQTGWQVTPLDHLRDSGGQSAVNSHGKSWAARPDWQLDPIKHKLIHAILKQVPRSINTWHIYHALLRPYDALGKLPAIEAVGPTNLHLAARLVAAQSVRPMSLPRDRRCQRRPRQAVQQLVETAMMIDATEDLAAL